jgi:hypothetical protein
MCLQVERDASSSCKTYTSSGASNRSFTYT